MTVLTAPVVIPFSYFGKLPTRGDFIRSRTTVQGDNTGDIDGIDHWVSEALSIYTPLLEGTESIYFSHINTTEQNGVTGCLIASHDSNNRHYPIIGFGTHQFDKPKKWLNYLPVKSHHAWQQIRELLQQAKDQPTDSLATDLLNNAQITVDNNASTHYYDFINKTTLDDWAYASKTTKPQLIQSIIATGLLFLPTFTKGFSGLNKTLCWELSDNQTTAIALATYWHDLIHGFHAPHSVQLNTYLYQAQHNHHMTMSFGQPKGNTLAQMTQHISHPHQTADNWIHIDQSDWVQDYIDNDIGLTRFRDLLSQDNLYLYDIRQLFKQIFLAQ